MHTKLTLCLSLHYRFPNNEGLHNLIHGMWLAISAFLKTRSSVLAQVVCKALTIEA